MAESALTDRSRRFVECWLKTFDEKSIRSQKNSHKQLEVLGELDRETISGRCLIKGEKLSKQVSPINIPVSQISPLFLKTGFCAFLMIISIFNVEN